jgi:hypothetical protein
MHTNRLKTQACNSDLLSGIRVMLLVAVAIMISACVNSEISFNDDDNDQYDFDDGPVEQWVTPFARLGIVPVLPPSEDVRVGDIYVFPFNPDPRSLKSRPRQRGGLAASPRWTTLNLLAELQAEYQLRPDWPATPDSYLQISDNPAKREWAEPRAPENRSIFAEDSVPSRLRNFGLSEMSTFTLLEGDVNALVPTEAINLVLGTAWNDDKAVSIRMNSAETYSLGLHKIIEAALDNTEQGPALKTPYRDHLALIADAGSDRVWMRILSEVVYVRSIDIIIQSQSGFEEDEEDTNATEFVAEVEETVTTTEVEMSADEVADGDSTTDEVAAETDEEGESQVGAAGEMEVVTTETVSEVIPDHVLDPAYTAFVRANAINELLIELDADDLPGGFLRFVSITDDSVTVRRIWQRGLAIGARGLTLEVDKTSGEVLRSANMGTLRPLSVGVPAEDDNIAP